MKRRFSIHDSLKGWWEIRDSDNHVDLIELPNRSQAHQVCDLLNNLQREWEQKALATAGDRK
jgi:hypothetical protein